MDENTIKGAAKDLGGNIKGTVGDLTGDSQMQAEGTIDQVVGTAQRALAEPGEHDTIKVHASAQSPGAFHRHIAEVLGIPMHKVELDIRRLGGGFGGKESTAVWMVAPAMAAFILKRPVKLVLGRRRPRDASQDRPERAPHAGRRVAHDLRSSFETS